VLSYIRERLHLGVIFPSNYPYLKREESVEKEMDSKLFSLLSKQRKKAFSEKKRPFTSGIEVVDVVACTFLFFFGMPLREQGAKKKIKPNIMNLLRPLSPHRPIVQICVRYLFLATIVLFFYLLCLKIGLIGCFFSWVSKVGFLFGGRALSFVLLKLGCSGGLTLWIVLPLRALLTPALSGKFDVTERGGCGSF
jgi:hypothetical protein